MKQALLIIDAQNDFCDSENGALGVPGAENDCQNIIEMIKNNPDNIYLTLDSHYVIDISHPYFWIDKNGNHPSPLTTIKSSDLYINYFPLYYKEEAINYIKELEENGNYNHTIWPVHCIIGSWGHRIQQDIMNALIDWSVKNGKNFNIIRKGENILTEHFGAFKAEVLRESSETHFNYHLYAELNGHDIIHITGEAKSHCVANTLKQINDIKPHLNKKLRIHENCMSSVPGFENIANSIFEKSQKEGAIICG